MHINGFEKVRNLVLYLTKQIGGKDIDTLSKLGDHDLPGGTYEKLTTVMKDLPDRCMIASKLTEDQKKSLAYIKTWGDPSAIGIFRDVVDERAGGPTFVAMLVPLSNSVVLRIYPDDSVRYTKFAHSDLGTILDVINSHMSNEEKISFYLSVIFNKETQPGLGIVLQDYNEHIYDLLEQFFKWNDPCDSRELTNYEIHRNNGVYSIYPDKNSGIRTDFYVMIDGLHLMYVNNERTK